MATNRSLAQLRLLQLADSALPIGAQAHSFGLESLVADHLLAPHNLHDFFLAYLAEQGKQEAAFCRAAYQLPSRPGWQSDWLDLNRHLSALRTCREPRMATATLGRRFLLLVANLEADQRLQDAVYEARAASVEIHLCTAFGLVSGILQLGEEESTLAYLQQSLMGMLSAVQRLLPIGQQTITSLLWNLQPALADAAQNRQRGQSDVYGAQPAFTPLLEIAAMRHPRLPVRLFIT